MRKMNMAAAALALGTFGFVSSSFGALDPLDHSIWREDAGYEFGAAPADALETGNPFFGGQAWDRNSRTIATAEVTTNVVSATPLTSIVSRLWTNDVDLYKIRITDPNNFSIKHGVDAPANPLQFHVTLFGADGTAIAASSGGGLANAITDANTTLTGAGDYYVGISVWGAFPQNRVGHDLFQLSTYGVKAPTEGLSDYKLGTDPWTAWTRPGSAAANAYLIYGSLANYQTLYLSGGASFSVVPEPSSLMALGAIGTGMLLRRRSRVG